MKGEVFLCVTAHGGVQPGGWDSKGAPLSHFQLWHSPCCHPCLFEASLGARKCREFRLISSLQRGTA